MAATYGTASELSRRGFNVCLTMSNTSKVDLLCSVPDGMAFKVEVKGITYAAGLRVQDIFFAGEAQNDLFLVVVHVPPPDSEGHLRFFILTHKEAQDAYRSRPGSTGLNWGDLKNHEHQWAKFPAIPRSKSE